MCGEVDPFFIEDVLVGIVHLSSGLEVYVKKHSRESLQKTEEVVLDVYCNIHDTKKLETI